MGLKNVSNKAVQEFYSILSTDFDNEPRTRIGELLRILEEEGDFFPDCHSWISICYCDDLNDIANSQKHVDIALKQDPNCSLALAQSIRLEGNKIGIYAKTASKVLNFTKNLDGLGTIINLSSFVAYRIGENSVKKRIINDAKRLANYALPNDFDPDDGFERCTLLAEVVLCIQDQIRSDKFLFSNLKTQLALSLLNLPWDRIKVNDDQKETRSRLLKRIRGETLE